MVNSRNYVYKRDGRKEEIHLDKITSRIQKLCYGLNMDYVDPVSITLKVISGLYPGVTTAKLDNLAAETAVVMSMHHPDYGTLAARIAVSNLHKETKKHFSDAIEDLYNAVNQKTGRRLRLISDLHYAIIVKNANRLNSCIIYDRDFFYDYFALKIMERESLLKINGKIAERPQHMLMRVAVGIHREDIDAAIETYNYMSEKYFTFPTGTLLSAATKNAQLCYSYLVMMPADSLEGIYECITRCAILATTGADVGVNIHNIRAKGTPVVGTGGLSNGLIPMLRVFNNSAVYATPVGQCETQTIYLEPWHADIIDVLNLKKGSGKDEYRARDLMYALWVPDLFMKRVKNDEKWSLMCPHQSADLINAYGEEFEKKYEKYEAEGRYIKQIPARDIWRAICINQMETGSPYILYKDACNRKCNQQNLGIIRSGSFSTDLVQFTSPVEIAVGNVAAIALNMFVNTKKNKFDFKNLKEVVKVVTKNLNTIIDVTSYPLPQAQKSNLRHRPIAIGVQGLADTFMLLRMPFDSEEARLLNKQIFETLYYGALEASTELSERDGTYSSYEGSPISKGILQFDLWEAAPTNLWDWASLKQRIIKYGVRNSLLTAVIPTTATADILSCSKSTEPYTSNILQRSVESGHFQVINEHLLKDLSERELWNDAIKNQILSSDGSIQKISGIPEDLKRIYKTAWEMSQKVIIEMVADRGAFVDHSEAMKIHIPEPSYAVVSSMHFYGWHKGLKTGLCMLKMKPAVASTKLRLNKVELIGTQENGATN